MGYEVRISPLAKRQLKKLKGRAELREIVKAIDSLATEPHPVNAKKLSGHPFWRVRVGDFRIVYAVEQEQVLLLVLKVGQRKDIYQGLEELARIHRRLKAE